MQANPSTFHLRITSLSAGAALGAIGVAGLVLAGWALGIDTLKSFAFHLAPLKPEAAAAFGLAGVSLWLLQERRAASRPARWAAWGCASAVATIGLLALARYALGWEAGGGRSPLLAPEGSGHPGGMAPSSALSLLLIGLSLLLLDRRTRGGRRPAQIPVALLGILTLTALLGYAYHAAALYAPASVGHAMSLPGAFAGVLCFVSLALARPGPALLAFLSDDNPGGLLARRFLFPVLVVPFLLDLAIAAGIIARVYDEHFAAAAHVILQSGFFLVLVWVTATSLNRADARRREAEEALRRSRDDLEARVQERTAEFREASASLDAERRQFREVLDNLPAYVILVSRDHRVPFINRFFRERFGDSNGKRCFEFLFGRTEPCENCETFKPLQTGAPHFWEWTGPDGRQYDISDFPFRGPDGETLVLEMGLDVTERKRTEAELASYRDHLEELVRDRTAELEVFNSKLQEEIAERERVQETLRWNARRDELLSATASRLLATDDPQGLIEGLCTDVMRFLGCQVFLNFLADGAAGRLRLNAWAGIPEEEAEKLRWLDPGTTICGCVARDRHRLVAENIQTTPGPMTDLVRSFGIQAYCCHPLLEGNRLLGTLSFGTRTRPRFTAEEISVMNSVADLVAIGMARIESEQTLQWLASFPAKNPNPILEMDEGGRIHYANPAARALFPDLDGLQGNHPWLEDWASETRSLWEGSEESVGRNIHCTGAWYQQNFRRVKGARRVRVYGVDITERMRAEEDLRRSNENLEQFAYVASHDLQEPLRMMASYSELLERRYKDRLDADAGDFIAFIVDGAKRMQRLINDLLAYSRVGRKGGPPAQVDCNAVLDLVVAAMKPSLEESGALVTRDDLPVVTGSESQTVQLFQNLVGNALKFRGPTPPPYPRRRLEAGGRVALLRPR